MIEERNNPININSDRIYTCKMTNNSTIINFLSDYGDAPYVSVSRALDIRPLMIQIHDGGLKAKDCFNEIVCQSFDKPGYVILPETQFLNGTKMNVRTYFWAKIKFEKYVSMPDCIAVFCEKKDKDMAYRVSLEQDDKKSFYDSRINRQRALDIPLEKNLQYVISMEDKSVITSTDANEVRELLAKGKKNKFQICFNIENAESLDDMEVINKLKDGIALVTKYYEHIATFYDKFFEQN